MESLAANPSGSSGIYGMPSQGSNFGSGDALSLLNQIKDREMHDFKDKANFMSDLSIRQGLRERQLFSPEGQDGSNQQPKDVRIQQDPNQMTAYEKGELGVRQADLGLRQAELAQKNKFGQEALDIKSAQEKLNQQKSDQINAQKQADMQRKIEESNQKLEIARQALEDRSATAEARLEAQKTYQAAVEERHKAEMTLKEHQFNVANEQHDRQIKALEERIKQQGRTQTTTEVNPEGNKRTTTTTRGSATQTVKGIGKDGKEYDVPIDQIDDWNANHAAPGTEIKQKEQ